MLTSVYFKLESMYSQNIFFFSFVQNREWLSSLPVYFLLSVYHWEHISLLSVPQEQRIEESSQISQSEEGRNSSLYRYLFLEQVLPLEDIPLPFVLGTTKIYITMVISINRGLSLMRIQKSVKKKKNLTEGVTLPYSQIK